MKIEITAALIIGSLFSLSGGETHFILPPNVRSVCNPLGITYNPNISFPQISPIPPDPCLGFRLDQWQLVNEIPSTGASLIRIAGPTEELNLSSNFELTINMAEKGNLTPIVVFNPGFPRPDYYYHDKLTTLLSQHPEITIELGNEPDNKTTGNVFWQGDMASFVSFVDQSYVTIRSSHPDTEIIIAATTNPELNQREMLKALANTRINFRDPNLFFGLHVYNSLENLIYRMNELKKVLNEYGLNQPHIAITELGLQNKYRFLLPQMVATAYDLGAEIVLIHEYLDNEGWGFYNPSTGKKDYNLTALANSVRARQQSLSPFVKLN